MVDKHWNNAGRELINTNENVTDYEEEQSNKFFKLFSFLSCI